MEEKITAWLARDKGDSLFLYIGEKPIKQQFMWNQLSIEGKESYPCSAHFEFPKVKWEDKEPTKVEVTIKICE